MTDRSRLKATRYPRDGGVTVELDLVVAGPADRPLLEHPAATGDDVRPDRLVVLERLLTVRDQRGQRW